MNNGVRANSVRKYLFVKVVFSNIKAEFFEAGIWPSLRPALGRRHGDIFTRPTSIVVLEQVQPEGHKSGQTDRGV